MNRFAKVSLIVLVAMLAATTAFALNKTSSFAVTADIQPACAIVAHPLAFGTYDPLGVNATQPLYQTTTISIQCVDELDATVTLDQGLYPQTGSTSDVPLRAMQCADMDQEFMNYFLYQDSAHTKVWGAGANDFSFTADGTGHDYTVYGAIPPGQVLEDGGFADTVVATVSY